METVRIQMPAETPNVLTWYGKDVRPLLEDLAPDRATELGAQAERLERLVRNRDYEVAACFLGQSGIGKSTLINAIVGKAQIILPAGGVGPLTAQALEVSHAERPRFEVTYQGRQQLWQLVFVLDQKVAKEKAAAVDTSLTADPDADTGAVVEEAPEEMLAHYIRQARLIVCGDQNAPVELAYVVDGLRRAGNWQPRWGTEPNDEDENRLRRVSAVLKLAKAAKTYVCESHTADSAFMAELRCHAAGFLSPLIRHLQLGWPSHVLHQGLRLVDLPGVGISSDAHRLVTEKWVRERARAVCLVVHRGIDSDSANLLHTSGFLNRLLHSADDPSVDPVHLFVAVTKLDELAQSEYQEERQTKIEGYRTKREHMASAVARVCGMIRQQLEEELRKLVSQGEAVARIASEETIGRLVAGVQVFPLSAHEYTKLERGDEDDRAFIREATESGVPAMQDALARLVQDRHAEIAKALNDAAMSLRESCRTVLSTLEAQWSAIDVDSPEDERIRRELQAFIASRREEFAARRARFQEFLKVGVPDKIEALVDRASSGAAQEMRRVSRRFHDYHWATLRAAVRRGGTFAGSKHVDIPRDYALIYDGQVAPVWGQEVIRLIRSRTSELGEDFVQLITEIVDWAEGNGARGQKRVLEALRDEQKADAKVLATVGRDASNELREKVKEQLLRAVSAPIQRRCQKFVDDGADVGRGVRDRILRLFEDLIEVVIDAAKPPALKTLNSNYGVVQEEIRERLRKNPDPLKRAEEAVIGGHEEAERRRRLSKRKRVLEHLATASAAMPSEAVA